MSENRGCSRRWRWAGTAWLAALGLGAGPLSAAAAPPLGMAGVLQEQYKTWAPVEADTTPLALLRQKGFEWDAAAGQLQPLYDDARGYAELRGAADLPDGRQSIGVLRAGLYRHSTSERVLVLNDDWCAAGLCKARTRFVLLRTGQPDTPLQEPQLVPKILDADLMAGPVPICLRGVILGVQYLPSRFDASLTAMATVPPAVRAACDRVGTEVGLVTRALRLTWNASARKFVRDW